MYGQICDIESFFLALRQKDFPLLGQACSFFPTDTSFRNLHEKPQKKPFIYLDSAATSLKPLPVIDSLRRFYVEEYATVHRAVYSYALEATRRYDQARAIVQRFINAKEEGEVIFTRGTTDSVNIIADALVHSPLLNKNTTILVSAMEHHSNLVPWQMAAERSQAQLKIIPLQGDRIDLETLEQLLEQFNVAIVSVAHCSNILGTVNPISRIADMCHNKGAYLFVDGAQAAPHLPIDVQSLQCDFYSFSSHKLSGPTGVGVLWGRKALLEELPPPRGGGDMIDTVTFEKATFAPPPLKFEPGTPPIAEAIGLGEAITYLLEQCGGMSTISLWERELTQYLRERLLSLGPRMQLFGNAHQERGSLQSFTIEGSHPLDVATLLDLDGICIRSGHLCGQPLLASRGLSSVLRASVAYYNTKSDIDSLVQSLQRIMKIL